MKKKLESGEKILNWKIGLKSLSDNLVKKLVRWAIKFQIAKMVKNIESRWKIIFRKISLKYSKSENQWRKVELIVEKWIQKILFKTWGKNWNSRWKILGRKISMKNSSPKIYRKNQSDLSRCTWLLVLTWNVYVSELITLLSVICSSFPLRVFTAFHNTFLLQSTFLT